MSVPMMINGEGAEFTLRAAAAWPSFLIFFACRHNRTDASDWMKAVDFLAYSSHMDVDAMRMPEVWLVLSSELVAA